MALALLGLLAYIGTVGAPFIYDDYNAIVENPHVRSLWPLGEAMSAPDESTVSGRPVAALSLALNYAGLAAVAGSPHQPVTPVTPPPSPGGNMPLRALVDESDFKCEREPVLTARARRTP